jgi:hypothetical protein
MGLLVDKPKTANDGNTAHVFFPLPQYPSLASFITGDEELIKRRSVILQAMPSGYYIKAGFTAKQLTATRDRR